MKRKQLIQNCHGLVLGVEKFSGVINISVAAASKPTTAGRNPVKTLFTNGVFMYFMNILLIRIMRINEGSTKAKVAVILPKMAMGVLYPAFITAV